MPKTHLTIREINKISFSPTQVIHWDTKFKGFGLLVGSSTKTFIVKTNIKDPVTNTYKTVKATIGRYPEVSPEEARKRAPDILQRLRTGQASSSSTIPTLKQLYEAYFISRGLSSSSLRVYKIYMETFSSWHDMPINILSTLLTPNVIMDMYDDVKKTSGIYGCANIFKNFQSVMNYGRIKYPQFITSHPCQCLTDGKMWPPTRARTDCLQPSEYPKFLKGIQSFKPGHRDALLLALFLGIRPSESALLMWKHVDLDNLILHVHHETETSKKSYQIPINRQAEKILSGRPKDGPYVFGTSRLRAETLSRKTGLQITCHGLRRSFIVTGERLRCRREDLNFLTGHKDKTVLGSHYTGNPRMILEELRSVSQQVASEIERLLSGKTAKIIRLH